MNFLEELAAEWYEYKGYFVKRNIKFGGPAGKSTGGRSGEIDIIAYQPKNSVVVHIETSSDCDTWESRKKKFQEKKFTELATAEYTKVLGFTPKSIERIAIVSYTKKPRDINWQTASGSLIEIQDIPTFIAGINSDLQKRRHARETSIPEQLPLLRAIHHSISYGALIP